jgi:hypothetical protein
MRAYFSINHIQAATHFAKRSRDIEESYDGIYSEQRFVEHSAYVVGSIFATASFLEATINEFFQDAMDDASPHYSSSQLPPEIKITIANMWKSGVPRTAKYTILEKFQLALAFMEKKPFEPGIRPFQEIELLIKLRNALIHFEPEWAGSPSIGKQNKSFEEGLKGKFALNPLYEEGNSFFPDRCLGYGCARWAVDSSVRFADEFFSRIGITPTFDHVRSRLNLD